MTARPGSLRCVPGKPAGLWRVTRCDGPASALVELPVPDEPSRRLVRICSVSAPAFVLGSTQPSADVDEERAAARGVEVCRRRSGGGAVLVEPGAQLWFDAFVPAADALFEADVGLAFGWLGRAVGAAVTAVTGLASDVHAGALVRSRWSSRLCLAGLGPGEVSLGERKVLGVAQRRDRSGAWFQAMVLLRFDPSSSTALLSLPGADREAAADELAATAGAVGAEPDELEKALLEAFSAA